MQCTLYNKGGSLWLSFTGGLFAVSTIQWKDIFQAEGVLFNDQNMLEAKTLQHLWLEGFLL